MFKSFSYFDNGEVLALNLLSKYSTKKLEPAIYELRSQYVQGQGVVHSLSNDLDVKVHEPFRSASINTTLQFIDKFYKPATKALFKKLNYVYKAGLLFHGKQGGGKTNLILYIAQKLVTEKKAIVFVIPDRDSFYYGWEFIETLRKNHTNPIVVVYDECEKFFEEFEEIAKTRLDGVESIDNMLCLFATNYIDKIPESIKERPSRIKYTLEINGVEDIEEIVEILKRNYSQINIERDFRKEAKALVGATVDDIKNYIINDLLSIEANTSPKKLGFR